jgi:hypothetical protein
MYPCAKCERKFLYREDCDTHVAICDIAQRRTFKQFRFASAPRLIQSTIAPIPVSTEIAQLRAEVAHLCEMVEKMSRTISRAETREHNRKQISNNPICSFAMWLHTISATPLHLQAVFTGELNDGLEAVFRDAVNTDSPISARIMRTRTELLCFAESTQGGSTEWRKMTDTDYDMLSAELKRKLAAQFELWKCNNEVFAHNNELNIQKAVACMSKIYGGRGGAAAVRATEFRRSAQRIMTELVS